MALVIVGAFLLTPAMKGLGEAGRIVYFHVPCAWVSTLAYLVAAYAGIRYLATRDLKFDRSSAAAAQIGLLFTVLATASGAVWAQIAWGMWWNWDPRQVFIAMVMLLYGAYFALRLSIEQIDQRAVVSAVYAVFALAAAVFLTFVAIRLPHTETLHPSPVLPTQADQDDHSPKMQRGMEPDMRLVLFSSVAGFTGLAFWMWRTQVRLDTLSALAAEQEAASGAGFTATAQPSEAAPAKAAASSPESS